MASPRLSKPHEDASGMRRLEQELQKAVVEGLRYGLPSTWVVAHYPSGGYRTRAEAAIFKAMGVIPGFPDVMILGEDDSGSRAWFIELKTGSKELSDDQVECHDKLRRFGFDVTVARSWEDVLGSCRMWGLPMKVVGF